MLRIFPTLVIFFEILSW